MYARLCASIGSKTYTRNLKKDTFTVFLMQNISNKLQNELKNCYTSHYAKRKERVMSNLIMPKVPFCLLNISFLVVSKHFNQTLWGTKFCCSTPSHIQPYQDRLQQPADWPCHNFAKCCIGKHNSPMILTASSHSDIHTSHESWQAESLFSVYWIKTELREKIYIMFQML